MPFQLIGTTSNGRKSVELTQSQWTNLWDAHQKLVTALGAEERYDLVVSNYAEFEKTLLELSVKHIVRFETDWFTFSDDRNEVNRRFMNFLSSFRSFVDQTPHDLKVLYDGHKGVASAFNHRASQEFDSVAGYRILSDLRNYVQHRGCPIHSLSYHRKKTSTTPGAAIRMTATPLIMVKILSNDSGTKKRLVEELKQIGDKVDVRPLVRQTMGSLSRLQSTVRELIKPDVQDWEKSLRQADTWFLEEHSEKPTVLFASEFEEDGAEARECQIFPELIESRRKLESMNLNILGLEKTFASGSALQEDLSKSPNQVAN